MPLIHGKNWWWHFFKDTLFDLHTTVQGQITLGYGKIELDIPIDSHIDASAIYLNTFDEGIPVCVGDKSLVAGELADDHFVLHADIKADTCTVKWILVYEVHMDD